MVEYVYALILVVDKSRHRITGPTSRWFAGSRIAISIWLLLALVGCGSGQKCPNVGQSANDYAAQEFEHRCPTKGDAEQDKHKEDVESEAHEAEDVIKKRATESNASAVEEAAK
jgi:hypothetical protein